MGQLNIDSMSELSNDFSITWEIMVACIFIALVLGFVFMILIRYCAGLITWLFIISFLLLLVAGTGISAANYFGFNVNFNDKTFSQKAHGSTDTDYKNYYLAAFILLSITTLLAFCAVCCLCNKIRLSIAIMETSSIFVGDNPASIIMPLINVIAIALWLAFWVGSVTYLYSTGTRKILAK
jgi:choline transporter-like protein 2/4/5